MSPFELGRQRSQLFLGFSCFLYEQAQSLGVKTLYFCTREGQFFKAVFDALFAPGKFESGIGTQLLHASRQSVFPVSVLTPNGPDLSHLFRLYKNHSPKTLLASLGICTPEALSFFEQRGISPDSLAVAPLEHARLTAVTNSAEFRELVNCRLFGKKEPLLGYFSQQFKDRPKVALVDIGWRATVLAAIARLNPAREFVGLYLGLAHERNQFGPNCRKRAYGPDFDQSPKYIHLLHAVDVLEFICLANTPTTIGYELAEDGRVSPVFAESNESSAALLQFSIPFQDGVVSCAKEADPQELLAAHTGGRLLVSAMESWKKLLKRPPPSLVQAYYSLRSEESFGLAESKDQSRAPSLPDLLSAPFRREKRNALKRFLVYNQWSAGMLRRKDLSVTRRYALYFTMKLAEFYKRLGTLFHSRSRHRETSITQF